MPLLRPSAMPSLTSCYLMFSIGDLVAIVGQVGSGKSSLLGGLLGKQKLSNLIGQSSQTNVGSSPVIQNRKYITPQKTFFVFISLIR